MALSYTSLGGSGGGAASNDFSINIGSSGFTNISLSQSFPAGSYVITSTLSDTTLDIYLINEDGSNAGYVAATNLTSTYTIIPTKSFNKVVVYGATTNDTLSFEFKYVFVPTNVTDNYLGSAPRLISSSTSDLPNLDNTTTLTGQNFSTDVEITFTGTDAVARSAKSINRVSATSLIVTRPDTMPPAHNPYTITATNPGITAPSSTNLHKLTNSTTAGNAPVWVTAATLPSYRRTEAYSQTVLATDSDGGSSITYSVVSGSLPTGITFNTSTGVFSGTPSTNASSPYTYTVRATDAGSNFVDRAFIVQQLAPDAPTIGTATDVGTNRGFDNAAASVTFTPASTGPSATSYTVTAYQSGVATAITATGSSSPVTVTNLLSNTAYTFLVKANNASGSSLNSGQTSAITVTSIPQSPTIGTASRTSSVIASVPFTARATGGKSISNYDITSSPSSLNYTGAGSPISATGLAYNNTYTFQARAYNANGWSDYSLASNGIAITYPSSDSDNFNRTTTTALGNTSGTVQSWSNLTGTWFANGSQAQSNDANARAIIRMVGNFGTVQAGTVTAGVGLVYWASDANNLVASYPFYSATQNYSCGPSQSYSDQNPPPSCCGSVFGPRYQRGCECSGGCQAYCDSASSCPGCGTLCSQQCGSGSQMQYFYDTYYYCSTATYTATQIGYIRTIQIVGGSSTTVTDNTYQNASSISQLSSLRATTNSNGTVNLTGWVGANFTGTQYGPYTVTPSTGTRSNGYGLIKAAYGSAFSQGSVADDFSTSGF
jgi:hypothetical protein